MSLDAMDWVWEHSQSKGVARLVMLAIADRAVAADCKAYASLTALQERANAGRSTVIGAIRDLAEIGELEIVQGESGRNGAAVYRIPKALGHLRTEARARRESVQKPDQSTDSGASQIGAETAPIAGAASSGIGAETEPIGDPEPGQTGAETAPIQPEPEVRIGADSGPESVQILDSIGAETAPQNNYKQLLNQEQIYIPGVPAAEAKPKRRRTRAAADNRTPVEPDAFAAFWTAYPNKDAKPAAIKAWNTAITERAADPKTLIDGAGRYRAWDGRDPGFTKNPSTWLNNDCWENPYEPVGRGHRSYQNPASDDEYEGDL